VKPEQLESRVVVQALGYQLELTDFGHYRPYFHLIMQGNKEQGKGVY
jgi:hypothetical protein